MQTTEGIPFITPLPSHGSVLQDRERVAVLGLGNILFSDEGAGVHVAAELARSYTFSPGIDIVDGGTMGLDLLPIFQDRDRILIIDAVDFGKSPGYVATLAGDAIRTALNIKLSVHHIGLSDLLLTAQLTRENPLDLCLVGIQPGSLDLKLGITEQVRFHVKEMINLVLQQLKKWNICVP